MIEQELMPLLEQLYDLLPISGGSPAMGTMSHHKAASSAPWNEEAGAALYGISAEARRLEERLRVAIIGYPGRHRGGSDANTVAALQEICTLVYVAPPDSVREAARQVSGWIRAARLVRDIGLEERAQPLPVRPGRRRPPCPYCGTFGLRVLPHDGGIWCINRDRETCKDRDGNRPRGTLQRSQVDGDGMIVWRDGRITRHRDLA